ncbi:MAG: LysR family transcriptional regulator [Cyanobacteria bacterium]|nr:LysR family transcriptional regulator [Cyanobacteriota bacterium]
MIQPKDVVVFLEILATGGINSAAAKLRLPKSSVVRQLSRLEHELSVTLFKRTTRSVALTADGEAFVPYARQVVDSCMEAVEAVRPTHLGAITGRLVVTAIVSIGQIFIAPGVPDFRRKYPGIRIQMKLTPAPVDVTTGEADVAIRMVPVLAQGIACQKLVELPIYLVAAPAYLKHLPPIRKPIGLAQMQIIDWRTGAAEYRLDLVSDDKTQCVRFVPDVETNDIVAAKQICLAGGGIAPLPGYLVENEIKEGTLVRVLPQWALPSIGAYIVYSVCPTPSAKVRAYVDFLRASFLKEPWRETRL